MRAVVADEPLEGPRLAHGGVLLLEEAQHLDEGRVEAGSQEVAHVNLNVGKMWMGAVNYVMLCYVMLLIID